jgi:hypothetical protein
LRKNNKDYNETTPKGIIMTWKAKLKKAWDEHPLEVIIVGTVVVNTAAKLIDAWSAAQGRKAYARQVNYRVNTRR